MTEGPLVIGGTGGSGTRVFARLARAGGVHIGTNLNRSDDQLEIAGYYDRWINRWLAEGAAVEAAMRAELAPLVDRHLADRPEGARWGWKEPRSIYLVDFLDAALPGFRFLHVVRDGRDMAFSANQNQLRKHGAAFLGADGPIGPRRSIALWAGVNAAAADYGEARLPGRYLRLRYEDLLDRPAETRAALARFAGVPPSAAAGVTIEPPATRGAWRSREAAEIEALEEVAGPALRRFGYR